MIPLWAVLGLIAAFFQSFMPLLQEKMKADGFAVAVWVKVAVVAITAPFAIFETGLPTDPMFYAVVTATGLLWCISDVVYFRAIPVAGAGVVTRVLPSAVIITFVLWLFVDPALMDKYIERPLQSAAIAAIILASAGFATWLHKCPVSWQGVRLVWFVIFAACVGPIIDKLALGYAPAKQAPLAFMFVQGTIMLALWLTYYAVRRPIAAKVLFSREAIRTGAAIGVVATISLFLRTKALLLCEHPAYLSVLLFTDALWVLLIYRLIGHKDGSNIKAGLGIVACAALLVLVKSL
jgi:hypothetical protein